MSTIKLTGTSSGSSIIKAPDSGSTNQTFTLPAATGTLLTTTGSGAALTGITEPPRKNLIINGAMQVSQRSDGQVAQANSSNEGYATLDRFALQFGNNAGGTITTSQTTVSPDGFGTAYKLNVTGADTSVSGNEIVYVQQVIEAQNIVNSGWNFTSTSSYLTLSFWVRNSKTGIYCVAFDALDATKMYTVEYTVSQADTWEKKTITIPGASNLSFNLDNGAGIGLYFMLANASGRYGSAGSWVSPPAYGTSNQVNFLDNTSNIMYLTGVKLEVGSTATDFEHKSYGEELALCQRYYQKLSQNVLGMGRGDGTAGLHCSIPTPVDMRASPTMRSTVSVIAYSHTSASVVGSSGVTNPTRRDGGHITFTLANLSGMNDDRVGLFKVQGVPFDFDAEL